MLLSDMKPGEICKIEALLGSGELHQRLLDIGFLPGRFVKVIRYAPLGDPIEVEVIGTRISLLGNEASLIRVHPMGKGYKRRRRRGRFFS